MVRFTARILDIVREVDDVWTYYLEKPDDVTWEEGAHLHIAHVGYDTGDAPNKDWIRHLSLCTLPQEGRLGFTTRIPADPSEFKRKLAGLGVGDELVAFKLGSRMQLRRANRPIVLLSMGIGLATFRPVLLRYRDDPSAIPSVISVNVNRGRQPEFARQLRSLESRQCHLHWPESREAYQANVQALPNPAECLFYLVGSEDFVIGGIRLLRTMGVADADIVVDRKEEVRADFFARA